MKKIILIYRIVILISTAIFVNNISGQTTVNTEKRSTISQVEPESVERRNAILFMAPGPILGAYYFEFQRALDVRNAVLLGLQYNNINYENKHQISTWLFYRYKLIPNKNGPLDGFGIAPGVQILTPLHTDKFAISFFPSLFLTYQWVFKSGFTIGLFAGGGYYIVPNSNTEYDLKNNTWAPSAGLNIGYSF